MDWKKRIGASAAGGASIKAVEAAGLIPELPWWAWLVVAAFLGAWAFWEQIWNLYRAHSDFVSEMGGAVSVLIVVGCFVQFASPPSSPDDPVIEVPPSCRRSPSFVVSEPVLSPLRDDLEGMSLDELLNVNRTLEQAVLVLDRRIGAYEDTWGFMRILAERPDEEMFDALEVRYSYEEFYNAPCGIEIAIKEIIPYEGTLLHTPTPDELATPWREEGAIRPTQSENAELHEAKVKEFRPLAWTYLGTMRNIRNQQRRIEELGRDIRNRLSEIARGR